MKAIWSTRFSARRDLRIQVNTDSKLAAYFNLLDPITRQSYRVGELEHSLLSTLNGNRTLAQVLNLLRKERPFESLGEQQLFLTVDQLQRNGLVRELQVSAGSRLGLSRLQTHNSARIQSWLSGFVSWQLRGLQPDAWLARLAPHTNAVFSEAAVFFWLLVAAVTCFGVLLEFPRLASQSSAWQWIVHPVQGSALFVVFLVTRALHELGHAVVCKRHGVRCPDIGLFIVLGAPCVYCDVSESWQLPNRWQRAAVAAAGMYVELIIATLAAWVWLLTVEGPASTVALQTMFVCSVSTVLINANPLMRFDGYYILSDILDESNLRGRADGIAETRLYGWILGRSTVPQRTKPQSTVLPGKVADSTYGHLLCVFSWMGWIYRAGLSLAIAGLLVSIYESWNIAWIGRLIAVLILISWWGIPSVKLAKNLIHMAERTNKRRRLAFVTAMFVGCIGLLPVPYRQFGSGWIQPESMRGVYAPATGILELPEEIVKGREDMPASGNSVDAGKSLFYIRDLDALQDKIHAEGLVNLAQAELNSYRNAQSTGTDTYEIALDNAKKRLGEASLEVEKRTIKSPCSGRYVVMPATSPTGPWSLTADSLQYNFDNTTQVGRTIPKGTMLATICGIQMVAFIPLNDSQLEWVFSGTEVRLSCAERPSEVHKCKVDKVVALDDVSAAWRLMKGEFPGAGQEVTHSSLGQMRGAEAYAAQVVLPDGLSSAVGAKADAVFIAPSQTVGSLCYRWLRQNLRWLAD